MTGLDKINGEALCVPGLAFRSHRQGDRCAIIAQSERGAVQLWSEPLFAAAAAIVGESIVGGVEIHSPVPLDGDPEPTVLDCAILGGRCWTDGSSLAFRDRFLPMIEARDSVGVLLELAAWHEREFGGAS